MDLHISSKEPDITTDDHTSLLEELELADNFRTYWKSATDGNNLSLFCFRRYRSIHLVNLRFLEDEIAKLDREIYQAGLQLDIEPGSKDRMKLRSATRDKEVPSIEQTITKPCVLKLRELLKEYDTTIIRFNQIMNMQTIALSDSTWLSHLRKDISKEEMYRTKLLRIDLPPAQRDPIRHILHRCLRKFWYTKRAKLPNLEAPPLSTPPSTPPSAPDFQSHQNTITITDFVARFLIACIAGAFLIFPLFILSFQEDLNNRLLTISLCIIVFAFLLSLISQASNQTVLEASAAYAAVLSVFVSSNIGPQM
ncbi:hypothetical protein BOTCAL_0965g00040 [Botryotinia calthae]|uniref:DUF6594 domain-containing protein n=1 Tax=Botryotinia calthae TaxID=38488 RepID=A0A4Y8CGM3_9HELO|nr:hypothetical protein BOTCAL_0965g00040 [Botryotinia calthae]